MLEFVNKFTYCELVYTVHIHEVYQALCCFIHFPEESEFIQFDRYDIKCHGGLFYDEFKVIEGQQFRIVGFHCWQWNDYKPGLGEHNIKGSKARSMSFVKKQAKTVIDQVIDMQCDHKMYDDIQIA